MSLISMIGPRPNLLGHARRHAQAARGRPADPDQRRPREDPLGRGAARRRVPHRDDRHHLGRRERRRRASRQAIEEMCWTATEAVLADRNILILSRPRAGSPTASRCRRCSRPRRCTITSSARACACRPGSSSRPARRARCITSACSPATAPRRSTPTSRSRRSSRSARRERPAELEPYAGPEELHQGGRQGHLKVMSKMGISTYQSYCGAQIFDAVGLLERVRRASTSPAPRRRSRASAWQEIAEEAVRRHAAPMATTRSTATMLDVGGIYQFRLRGEDHAWTPESVANLQHAVRGNSSAEYEAFAADDQRAVRAAADDPRADGAEEGRHAGRRSTRSSRPTEIVKRFATGAMSFGSISREAHTTLAIAMNRIGGARTPARAARKPTASSRCPTAIRCARRSSRSPRAASA